LLDIKGGIITIDAMGAQKSIASLIIQQQADYVLTLKANHSKLHQAVQQWEDQHYPQGFADCQHSFSETIEAGHHRVEIRRRKERADLGFGSTVPVESVEWLAEFGHRGAGASAMESNHD